MALNLLQTPLKVDAIPATPSPVADDLRGYVRKEVEAMHRFRQEIGLEQRLLDCTRMRDGQYDAQTMAEIKTIGGSEVYIQIVGNKIRSSYAILASIFTQGERPWDIGPTPDPTLPDNIQTAVEQVVASEIATLKQAGQPVPDQGQIHQRVSQLMDSANMAAHRRAKLDAVEATNKLDDFLVEGGFYASLNEFLVDFATYPVAFMRGPTAVMKTDVRYVEGKPTRQRRAVLTFERISPHDLLWSAGSTRIENANLVERIRMQRADLQALRGIEGFDDDAIVSALRDYGESGLAEEAFKVPGRDASENQPAALWTDTIDVLVYTGTMTGRMLDEFGVDNSDVEGGIDLDLEYLVIIYLCGEYVLKIQIDPDPKNRVPYYAAAYAMVPGSIVGKALPELMADIQEIMNSVTRSLVNNVALASGPQVVIDVNRLEDIADVNTFYPWKKWRFEGEPSMAQQKPIDFFQPQSNANELIGVFGFFSALADEVSAMPKYMTGNEKVGGAGRTSSGLSMLMSNANRSITSVAAGIDDHVLLPMLQKLYDLLLLATGTDILRGDENIVVKGATYAQTKETDRMRLIEVLQMTANPFDMQIMGIPGRSVLLKKVVDTLGMDGEEIVPTPQELQQKAVQAQQQQQVQAAAGQGDPNTGPQPGPQPEKAQPQAAAAETDNMHRVRSNPQP